MVADVQNFSDYSQSEEVRIVEAIWAELTAHDIWSRSDSNNIHFNGTGDGLLVAVLGDAIEHECIIDCARCLTKRGLESDPAFTLRVSLHFGRADQVKIEPPNDGRSKTRFEIIGKGANHCARLVRLATSEYVVVSEEFIVSWNAEGHLPPVIWPHPASAAQSVFVKGGYEAKFRFVSVSGGAPPRDLIPSTMVVPAVMAGRIWQELERIEQMIVAAFERSTAIDLSTRVSVFTKVRHRDRSEVLVSTRFRYHRNQIMCSPGTAEYSLMGIGVGIARAIRQKGPCFLSGLKDPASNLTEYQRRLEDEWDVTPDLISQWQRLPRTIIALPFGIAEFKDIEPEGCICIDLDSPLDYVAEDDLRGLSNALMEAANRTLAPLWRLRTLG